MPKIEDLPKWDTAEVLTTPELQAEYIRITLEEGTPEEIENAYKTVARAREMAAASK